MSHVCAKPACIETVQVWLDFAPSSRHVVETATRSDVSVGLCKSHADRFTVPSGWSLELLPRSSAVPAELVDAVAEPSTDIGDTGETADAESSRTSRTPETAQAVGTPANRTHTRERPWFLALSDVVIDESVHTNNTDIESTRTTADSAAGLTEPSAGSLLHRAFHGPDADSDRSRADRDQVDELEPRRAARTPREQQDNGMAELPFPPFEPEHRVAVS